MRVHLIYNMINCQRGHVRRPSNSTVVCARTSPSFRSKVYAALVKTYARRNTVHLHPLCAQRTSLRAADSPDKAQHQLSPQKLRIPILCYTLYNTISPSYTPLSGVMTALALRTPLILVVEFHAVCRCTICGAQVDSEVRIPRITMTVRVDIFTKFVTSNPQINQPKFPNQLCDSRPDLIEHATNVHLIPPLTTNTDARKQRRSTNPPFPSALSDPSSSSPQTHSSPHTSNTPSFLSRFTGIGFVHTKRDQSHNNHQPQSTRGRGHPSGPGSQRLGTGLL